MNKLLILAIIALICFSQFAECAKKTGKLQIGVKHRPESCTKDAKKTLPHDKLKIHYNGTLLDGGKKFDSSVDRGDPFQFTLGVGQVIKGWDQGLLNMCIGEKRKLVIPPELGYGDSGAGASIPGGAYLVFETELIDIIRD
ncbi:FKBP-type peptidylprolyl cis-trans isomerase [Cavenderia fasciculata]|uniref:peptidylprolyl isomerase n=1 Tax=Cavenderia fasciculata TaxID=261658 RepID=F4PPX3_CACFS|nr:FKBP-type peptidylprolyl cis-trans isomerase [Cavenderia fasciculata]EGG22436.1 FKBP-type peptidylprolyl cis-trans isomerase [Cavenderia fasciculata]|eukprot:XP_004360287.1 FKBP-type peptidylprolyl cis-trans isomerase [Cavenderia fasciculata]